MNENDWRTGISTAKLAEREEDFGEFTARRLRGLDAVRIAAEAVFDATSKRGAWMEPKEAECVHLPQWTCANCGETHDRDANAAYNLRTAASSAAAACGATSAGHVGNDKTKLVA